VSRTQWILSACGTVAGVNAVRQALFATAAVSPLLATLSGGVALISATAFVLLRRRHSAAAPALVAFAVALPLATILGTEPLLAGAIPLSGRLPGYLFTMSLGLLAAWGGRRELARARSLHASAGAAELHSAAPGIDTTAFRARQSTDAGVHRNIE